MRARQQDRRRHRSSRPPHWTRRLGVLAEWRGLRRTDSFVSEESSGCGNGRTLRTLQPDSCGRGGDHRSAQDPRRKSSILRSPRSHPLPHRPLLCVLAMRGSPPLRRHYRYSHRPRNGAHQPRLSSSSSGIINAPCSMRGASLCSSRTRYSPNRTGTTRASACSGKPEGLSFSRMRRPRPDIGCANTNSLRNGTNSSVIHSSSACA